MKTISAAKILLLLASLFFGMENSGILAQDLTLNEVRDKLLANPPVYGDSSIRRTCFSVLDEKFKSESAGWDPAIEDFYNGMLENVVSDISNPCSGLAVIYKMYNHGFIVKLQDMIIAFDLVPGMITWDLIPQEVLERIDVLLVSHVHSDHFNSTILDQVINLGGTVIIPEEINYPGATKLAANDSIIISGVKIIAHDGLHSVPVRIYEVTSPLGIKIMHTGDNQTSETLPENIEDLDILLLNSWVNESSGDISNITGMYNCLQKLKPSLMIPGHCNELWHSPSQRYAYDSVFVLQERHMLPSEVRVMAWCEKTIYKPDAVLLFKKTSITPVIDGQWDSTWAFIPENPMTQALLDPPADWLDLYSNFRAMWDDNNFYFFVSVHDDTLRTDNPDAWENDAVEIFFDGDNSKNDASTGYDENDLQMRFEYMGNSWHAPNSEFAFYKTTMGYNFEARIPSTDLSFDLTEDLIMGFDIQVTDNDQGAQNSILRWWSDNIDSWRWPALFGTSKLTSASNQGIKTIPYTAYPVQVDGILDNAWIGKKLLEMNHHISGEENLDFPGDLFIQWDAIWDENYLYFLFELQDDTLVADDIDEYWRDDCIEFWIDGDNSKGTTHDDINDFGLQFAYDPSLVINDVKQVVGPDIDLTDIKQAAKQTPEGLIIEIALPLDILGIEPYDSTLFGFDIDYNDDDDGNDRDSKVKTYAQYDTAWLHPLSWGTAILLGSGRVNETLDQKPEKGVPDFSCRIYPNPVGSELNINLDGVNGNYVNIQLTNLAGKSILDAYYKGIHGNFHTTIDTRLIPSGIYLVQIQTKNQFHTEKFIKIEY